MLNKLSSKINLDLPPKKYIGNMDRKLVMQRQNALQVTWNILKIIILIKNMLLLRLKLKNLKFFEIKYLSFIMNILIYFTYINDIILWNYNKTKLLW